MLDYASGWDRSNSTPCGPVLMGIQVAQLLAQFCFLHIPTLCEFCLASLVAIQLRPVALLRMHTRRLIHLSPTVTLSAQMHCLFLFGCLVSKGFKVVYFAQFARIYSEQIKCVGFCGIISEYVTNYEVAISHPIVMPFSLTVSFMTQCKNFPHQKI